MIPIAWVEPAALSTNFDDTAGHLRHEWVTVYRCPACNRLDSQRGGSQPVVPSAQPVTIGARQAHDLADLIRNHVCQDAS